MLKKSLSFPPYTVVEFIMNEGDEREFDAGKGVKRDTMGMVSLYLEGTIDILRDDKLVVTRQAGDFSADRPDIPPGRYRMVARTQPARVVCIGLPSDPSKLRAKVFHLPAGEGFGLALKHSLYVAKGTLSSGDKTYKPRKLITGAAFVTAQSDVTGVVVWSA